MSNLPLRGSACGSTSLRTASPPAKRLSSTKVMLLSVRGISPEAPRDASRRDHPHHPAQPRAVRRRAPRAGWAQHQAQPHDRARRGSPARPRRGPRPGAVRSGDGHAQGQGRGDRGARRADERRRAGRARGRRRRGRRPAANPRRARRPRRARVRRSGRLAEADEVGSEDGGVSDVDDRALLRRYHEDGDLAARDQLIEQYMSLVRSLARRYAFRGEPLDDLVQIGAIGLIKAIDRFDVDRGVELTTYATPNIIGEIKRHFRDKGWSVRVPRGLQELNVQLSKLIEEQTIELGRSPTIPELAKAAGVEEELVVEALESGRAYSSVSLSTGGGQDEDGELDPLESLGAEEPQYEISEDRAMLAPGFAALDERERLILHLRFFKGLTQSQIAQQVGISQMHVSRLIRRALERIREEIVDDGRSEERRVGEG